MEDVMGTDRIKQLRKQKGLTQAELAELLNVGLSTVAMWENGKRTPNFKLLNDLSDMFDKKIDYILGTSDDDRSPKLNDIEISQLGKWALENECRKVINDYLSLDEFGKAAVESLIQLEKLRCVSQQTISSKLEEE